MKTKQIITTILIVETILMTLILFQGNVKSQTTTYTIPETIQENHTGGLVCFQMAGPIDEIITKSNTNE